jgi:hypothetical protein
MEYIPGGQLKKLFKNSSSDKEKPDLLTDLQASKVMKSLL